MCLSGFREVQSTGETHTPSQTSNQRQQPGPLAGEGVGRGPAGEEASLAPSQHSQAPLSTHPDSPSARTALSFSPSSLSFHLVLSMVERNRAHRGVTEACQEQAESKPQLNSQSLPNPPGYLPLQSPLSSAG